MAMGQHWIRVLIYGAAGLVLLGVAGAAAAGELREFNSATAAAYAHYRGAVSYLRTGNVALAAVEIEQMAERWQAVQTRFAARPPDAFADDPRWRVTLDDVAGWLTEALAAVDAGDMERAGRALAPIRDALGELRRRNHVVVFSDCVNELSEAMARLWRYRREPPDFAAAADIRALRAGTAVLGYLFGRCDRQAPAAIGRNPEFRRLVDGAAVGIDRLWRAIDENNQALFINTLRELRSFERILFLRFG